MKIFPEGPWPKLHPICVCLFQCGVKIHSCSLIIWKLQAEFFIEKLRVCGIRYVQVFRVTLALYPLCMILPKPRLPQASRVPSVPRPRSTSFREALKTIFKGNMCFCFCLGSSYLTIEHYYLTYIPLVCYLRKVFARFKRN